MEEEERNYFRDTVSKEIRNLDAKPYIDPGFVNRRKIGSIIGLKGMELVDRLTKALPELPDYMLEVRLDHIYTEIFLAFCDGIGVKSLEECVITKSGTLISSTIRVAGCEDFYTLDRPTNAWIPDGSYDLGAELQYSRANVRSDTLRSRLAQGSTISVIAEVTGISGKTLLLHPLVMGFPWLRTKTPEIESQLFWHSYEFFENYVEDISEFELVRNIPIPTDFSAMKKISEAAFKQCLGEILHDNTRKDWGGEMSDHFSTNVHIGEKRLSAAFLLKGPAHFAPMGLNHLGKNNDQIYRLSNEPADILFVQHCHDILPPVRETLRAFSVRPHRARRYCLIDGKDSLRLLIAYNLLDKAISLSSR
jgi:hypothetical protein